jgi:hypothetical protein
VRLVPVVTRKDVEMLSRSLRALGETLPMRLVRPVTSQAIEIIKPRLRALCPPIPPYARAGGLGAALGLV